MSAASFTLHGLYFDGRGVRGERASLLCAGREAALIGASVTQRFKVAEVRVSPRVGRAGRFVALPGGGQFHCEDDRRLDRLPQEVRSEGLPAWLEQRLAVALAAVAVIVALLLAGYFYVLPLAAKHAAVRVPIEAEQALGRQAIAWLDENGWFKPSALDPEIRGIVADGFAGLARGLPLEPHYRLEFRRSFVGANAFALPGGIIVITDDMVAESESPDEVLAVLAHEIGHVEQRHSLRHLLQGSAVAAAIATLTADAASLSVAVAGFPALLAQAKYSREFEREADSFGFALLAERGYSPDAFATLMKRLAEGNDDDAERTLAFLSTHPVTDERVERARAATPPEAQHRRLRHWPERDWRPVEEDDDDAQ